MNSTSSYFKQYNKKIFPPFLCFCICLSLFLHVAVPDQYSGIVSFGSSRSYARGQYPNLTTYTIGNIGIYVNGSYYDLCADQLTPTQASLLCNFTGYDGHAYLFPVLGPVNETFSYGASSNGISNFSCPHDYFGSSCTYNIVYGNGCTNNGGRAVISCLKFCKCSTCIYCTVHYELSCR